MNLMTVDEVAEALKITPHRVYEMIRERLLPAVRLGRQVRVSEEALREWIAQGGCPLPGGWKREPDIETDHVHEGVKVSGG